MLCVRIEKMAWPLFPQINKLGGFYKYMFLVFVQGSHLSQYVNIDRMCIMCIFLFWYFTINVVCFSGTALAMDVNKTQMLVELVVLFVPNKLAYVYFINDYSGLGYVGISCMSRDCFIYHYIPVYSSLDMLIYSILFMNNIF